MDTQTFRILMIEDDGSIAQLIRIAMQTLGVPYHMDQAYTAEDALVLWQKAPYDLVLTDYNLRGITGLGFIDAIQKQGYNVPTLLFTAYDAPKIRAEAKALGVSAFIPKPFFLDEFVHVVRGLLPPHAREAGA
jgi:two-component system OmpR family response regulator